MGNWEDGYTFEMYERNLAEEEHKKDYYDGIWDYADAVVKDTLERRIIDESLQSSSDT